MSDLDEAMVRLRREVAARSNGNACDDLVISYMTAYEMWRVDWGRDSKRETVGRGDSLLTAVREALATLTGCAVTCSCGGQVISDGGAPVRWYQCRDCGATWREGVA